MLIAILSLTLGCSTQWRDGEAGITADQLAERLESVGQSSGTGVAEVLDMLKEGHTQIFFAESGTNGPPSQIASLYDFSFLGVTDRINFLDLQEVEVYFFDQYLESGQRNYGLIVGLRYGGQSALTYYGISGQGGINDDLFEAVLGDSLALTSTDIDEDGEFNTVIQLQAYDPSSGKYLGKFPALVGFTP